MKWQGHIYETPISRLAMRNLSTWYSFWRGTCRNNFCTAVKWLVKIFDKTKDAYRLTRINIFFCLSFSQQLLKLNLVVWVSLTAWIWRLCRLSSVRTCKIIRKRQESIGPHTQPPHTLRALNFAVYVSRSSYMQNEDQMILPPNSFTSVSASGVHRYKGDYCRPVRARSNCALGGNHRCVSQWRAQVML